MPPYATGRRPNERPNEPETIDYLMAVTNTMGEAITATHGLTYSVGQSRDVVGYAAGGTTEDYSYDDLKIPLTWVYELRDKGRVHQSPKCSPCLEIFKFFVFGLFGVRADRLK